MRITRTQKLMAITTLLSAVVVIGTTVQAQLDTMEDVSDLPVAPLGEPMWMDTGMQPEGEMGTTDVPSFPTEEEMMEPSTSNEAEIGSAEAMDSFVSDEGPAEDVPAEPAAPEESSDPFEGKSFYRGGEKIEVHITDVSSEPTEDATLPAAPEETQESDETILPGEPNGETGDALIPEDTPALPEITDEQTVPEKTQTQSSGGSSLLSGILSSAIYIVGGGVFLVGGIFFMRRGKKKKGVTAALPPSAQTIAMAAESASPRLAQALKAMQAEESGGAAPTVDDVIPQEDTSPPAA